MKSPCSTACWGCNSKRNDRWLVAAADACNRSHGVARFARLLKKEAGEYSFVCPSPQSSASTGLRFLLDVTDSQHQSDTMTTTLRLTRKQLAAQETHSFFWWHKLSQGLNLRKMPNPPAPREELNAPPRSNLFEPQRGEPCDRPHPKGRVDGTLYQVGRRLALQGRIACLVDALSTSGFFP